MNQILQYIAIAGMSSVVFGVMFTQFNESLELETISQYEKNEILKKQSSEYLKVIEIMDDPLRIDLINIGSDNIIIKKLFIGGVVDDNYTIDGNYTNQIIRNKIITITPSLNDEGISLISENYKKFKFR